MTAHRLDSWRVAVVGLGPMGLHHARAYSRVPGARLVAVVDTHADSAAAAAAEFGCAALSDARDLIGCVDAVTVATPASTHAAVARPLLAAGVHCLIEKPLALTVEDCRALADAATTAVLRVGHIERFNPAYTAFVTAAPRTIGAIAARRLNAPGRAVSLDVVSDLMVHDIDLALKMKRTAVTATSARRLGAEHIEAIVTFADNSRATFAADRQAAAPVRDMSIITENNTVHLDFGARLPAANDPLTAELSDFLAACGGVPGIGATAADALAALDVVWRINRDLAAS